MSNYKSNSDKILQAVLLNEKLMQFGEYNQQECMSLEIALESENNVVHTVAQIIKSYKQKDNEASIYKEVMDFLKKNV